MKITINDQILSGNLGDGWEDQYETAKGLANYYEDKLEEFVKSVYPDADITIDMDVEFASGYSRGLSVDVTDSEDDYGIMQQLGDCLARYEAKLWETWCGGDGSDYFQV